MSPKLFTKWDTGQQVELSTADSNKWLLLKKAHLTGQSTKIITSSDYHLIGPIRQQQRRLTDTQVVEMARRYEAGATVYELAVAFSCHRTTVSARLKKMGVSLRLQSPSSNAINSMVHLYKSGLSAPEIGEQLGRCANTVLNALQKAGVTVRDTHGRSRKGNY